MKRLYVLIIALATLLSAKAQWVDDPTTNTILANCPKNAGEVLISPKPSFDGFYIQYDQSSNKGLSPTIQLVNAEGERQWGDAGIQITTPNLATWSPGYAMAALNDGVASMFRTVDSAHWVVKINQDGTFPWGEYGVKLFDGEGGDRSELLSTYDYNQDQGLWALGTDLHSSFLQYVNADGTLGNMATISDPTKKCTKGKLAPAENGVFVVYAKRTLAKTAPYSKRIYVAGYNKDGEQVVPETMLFGEFTAEGSLIHQVVPDNNGGAYAYQDYYGSEGYSIYVTHFDATGTPTIADTCGVAVHSLDNYNTYTMACATVDKNTNDIIIAYVQEDAESQTPHRIFVNRITETGEVLLGDGNMVADDMGQSSYNLFSVDADNETGGFVVIFATRQNTIEAVGFDKNNNLAWKTTLSSTSYNKTYGLRTSGFCDGQDVVAWINSQDGGLYGQNIGIDGAMGPGANVEENVVEDEEIVTLVRIINVNGQTMTCKDENELTPGIYILQGTNKDGKMVNKKTVIVRE